MTSDRLAAIRARAAYLRGMQKDALDHAYTVSPTDASVCGQVGHDDVPWLLDRITELEARWGAAAPVVTRYTAAGVVEEEADGQAFAWIKADDVSAAFAALLAERDALRAEVERLRWLDVTAERDALAATITKIRALCEDADFGQVGVRTVLAILDGEDATTPGYVPCCDHCACEGKDRTGHDDHCSYDGCPAAVKP